jgi:hypothetical protein
MIEISHFLHVAQLPSYSLHIKEEWRWNFIWLEIEKLLAISGIQLGRSRVEI